MIRFLDGPAAGEVLQLRRAPIYLRVAIDAAGDVDALDQPGDKPKRSETLFAYRLKGKAGWVHLLVRGPDRRRKGGYFATGEYEVIEPQPDDATIREQARWEAWATAEYEKTPGL